MDNKPTDKEEWVSEIGEFEDSGECYKVENGETIKISDPELHGLWMKWIALPGTERIVNDNLIRYIFPSPPNK